MRFFSMVAPSELLLLKVLLLGIYLGWKGKKVFAKKTTFISNIKFDLGDSLK